MCLAWKDFCSSVYPYFTYHAESQILAWNLAKFCTMFSWQCIQPVPPKSVIFCRVLRQTSLEFWLLTSSFKQTSVLFVNDWFELDEHTHRWSQHNVQGSGLFELWCAQWNWSEAGMFISEGDTLQPIYQLCTEIYKNVAQMFLISKW